MEDIITECDHKSQVLFDNIRIVMNTFEKQSKELESDGHFCKSETSLNKKDGLHPLIDKKKPTTNLESELWSVDSKPVTFAKSQGSNECDFLYVETVLPKFSHKFAKRSAECDDDCLSDGSQSHTVFTIAKLVSNLNKQKEENKHLQEQIECLKSEIAAAYMALEIERCNKENVGDLSALAEEIHSAEREREAAVMSRLKLAIQQRDEAQLKVKAYFNGGKAAYTKQELPLNNEKKLPELLDGLCHSSSAKAVEKLGSSIIALLVQMKKERKQIAEQEIGALIRERDQALHKCLNLSETVKDKNAELSKLSVADDSKTHQITKSVPIDAQTDSQDLDMLRLNYNLLKSLHDRVHSDDAERLVEALRVTEEHNRIQEAKHRRNEEQIKTLLEKNQRLERLVVVLRNKLASVIMS